jgi:hypothetical protein
MANTAATAAREATPRMTSESATPAAEFVEAEPVVLGLAEPVADADLDALECTGTLTDTLIPEGVDAGVEGRVTDAVKLEGELEPEGVVEFAEAEPEGEPEALGGGVPLEGSTSAPSPHGMGSPLGCVLCSGGTALPSVLAIVNLVVHRVTLEAGEVNW